MNKFEIIESMKVKPKINPEEEVRLRVEFIKKQLLQSGLSSLVLGISGGIDSATCGRLAQKAINELNEVKDNDYKFIAIRLPYENQKDEDDAQLSISFINPTNQISVNIKPGTDGLHDQVLSSIKKDGFIDLTEKKIDFAKGNVKARSRMAIQYDIACLMDGLVLGTDHSAENVTGFYTKWGDGACDLIPLFGLNKRQVRQVASYLGAPEKLIKKAPTADLECLTPQKKDEDVLGLSYNQIDDFLEGKAIEDTAEKILIETFNRTQHKRQAIPTIYD
jgi:NAD+ synthase